MTAAVMIALGTLALALLLARAWAGRKGSAERASRPKALVDAELVFMERLFRIRAPVPLVAKVDRVYRLPRGSLVLVELKTRRQDRPYLTDIIQLSAQRLAIEVQTGEVVEPFAFVSVLHPTSRRRWASYRVRLLDEGELVGLAQRRTQIVSLQTDPAYASSARACTGCAYRAKCDRFSQRV